MNMLLRERGSKPKRTNWVNVFSLLLATCALGIAIDVYGLVRLDSFEHTAHEAGHASGVLWVVPRRKHGEVLHLNGKDVGYELSCNTPGLGGSDSCQHDGRLRSGVSADVDWVASPHGLFDGTVKFPISIRQGGEVVLQVPVDQISSLQSRKVRSDILFLCVTSSVLALLIVFGRIRNRL